mmetsp:Transcript_965/g.2659  ORF Transcript_965/g.2659 Transcript_965/m.2659 type:complete len:205 (+) Transcript_965:114-728(+)
MASATKSRNGEVASCSGDLPEEQKEQKLAVFAALSDLLDIHGRRAMAYSSFDKAFRLFLREHTLWNAGAAATYVDACRKVTAEFSDCSAKAKVTEADLRRAEEDELAQVVRDIQELESTKLQLTVKYQTLRKDHNTYEDSCKHPVTGCGCVKSDFNTVFADEALYRHAVGRVQRELQSTIVSINDNVLTLMCEYDELKQELNNE